MTNPVLRGVDNLIAARRKQVAAVVDGLDAAKTLAEVVAIQVATTVDVASVSSLLDTAPNEETRGAWAALIARATQPVPPLNGDTP